MVVIFKCQGTFTQLGTSVKVIAGIQFFDVNLGIKCFYLVMIC